MTGASMHAQAVALPLRAAAHCKRLEKGKMPRNGKFWR